MPGGAKMETAGSISPEFPFESKYIDVHGSRMHYVEEGSGDPILFLHGNPTSSYLWRNIIPYLSDGARCIAPDLIGMGKSDKPDIPYRFFDHARYLDGFIEGMGLRNITLVVHDWGSGLGFHYAARNEGNVAGIAFMEAIVRPSKWAEFPADFKSGFKMFRTPGIGWLMICVMNVFVKKLLPGAVVRPLTDEEMARYSEPYPDARSRRPLHRWPNEIPIDGKPADVHEVVNAYSRWLTETELPKLLFYAQPGGIMRERTVSWCRENLRNLTTVDIGKGIHYLQEDNPHLIGEKLAEWHSKVINDGV
jgi:haloalkane dehalogenase